MELGELKFEEGPRKWRPSYRWAARWGSSEIGEFQEVSDSQPADDYQSENSSELGSYKSDISDPFDEVRDSQPADDQYQSEGSSELSSCKSDISDPCDDSSERVEPSKKLMSRYFLRACSKSNTALKPPISTRPAAPIWKATLSMFTVQATIIDLEKLRMLESSFSDCGCAPLHII